MPDPSYPCNRHFVTSFGGTPILVPASFEDRYQLGAHHVHERWTARTRGVLVDLVIDAALTLNTWGAEPTTFPGLPDAPPAS